MSGSVGRTLFFCLGTGAALGCLFLLFQALGVLLRAGKILIAALDLLFCAFTGAAVFLCALAVDHGRLRLLQVLCQGLGAWSAVTVLGPVFLRAAEKAERLRSRFAGFFRQKASVFARRFEKKRRKSRKIGKKAGKSRKKRKKTLEKLM